MTAREEWERLLSPFSLRAPAEAPLIQTWKRRKPRPAPIPTFKLKGLKK